MAKSPRPPLDELIAQTPAAQSLADAQAHIAARRNALGINDKKVSGADDSNVGKAEPMPEPIVELDDPPPQPKAKRPPRSRPPQPKKKPDGSHLKVVKSDKSAPEDETP